nr:protein YhfH [Evansella halocellulosilytica]
MLIPSTEFFKNLPPKECVKCGDKIDEMHDCYSHKCDNCEKEIH